MRQLNTPETPNRVAPACPNPANVTAGSHYINLTRTELGDPGERQLAGRDLRYWLLNQLSSIPGSHRVADLATAIAEDGFVISGRPSKTISDALHTETDRGRITRTGWGRYAITHPLAPTTAWRIKQRLITLNRRINQIILDAQRVVEQRWHDALTPHGIVVWLTRSATKRRLQAQLYVMPNQSRQPNGNRSKTLPPPSGRPLPDPRC